MQDYGEYDDLMPMDGPPAAEGDQVRPNMDMTTDDVSMPSYPPQLPRPLPPPLPMPQSVSPLMQLLGRNRGPVR